MPDAFAALVAHARTVCDAREWLFELSNVERDLIASTAYTNAGVPLEPIDDPRDYTRWVRAVYDALRETEAAPAVLLGDDRCVYCDRELVDDDCADRECEANYRRPTSRDRFGARNR